MGFRESFELNFNFGSESPSNFPVKERQLFKSAHKQEIGLLWSTESFEVKYNIGFGIPIKFPSLRSFFIEIDPETTKRWTDGLTLIVEKLRL